MNSIRTEVSKALGIIGKYGLSGLAVNANGKVNSFMVLFSTGISDKVTARQVYKQLIRQKLIVINMQEPDSYRISLTPNGAYRLLKNHVDSLAITPMKKWDHCWRLVCFDIPKGKDKERLYFNRRLHELGFTMLRRSMWVHPFDCLEAIKEITDYCNLTRHVNVLEISKLDDQSSRKLLRIYDSVLGATHSTTGT